MDRPAEFSRTLTFKLAIALLSLSIYWYCLQIFEDAAWTYSILKMILLCDVAVSSIALALYKPDACRNNIYKIMIEVVIAICGTAALVILLYMTFAVGAFSTKLEGIIILAIVTSPFVLVYAKQRMSWLSFSLPKAILICCVIGTLIQCGNFFRYLSAPDLENIAQTTIDAMHALLAGHNPYTLPIDNATTEPLYNGYFTDPIYDGYKYLPAMIAVYTPLSWSSGATGLRITNLILELLTAMLVMLVARREAGRDAGYLAAAIYLTLPMMPFDLYKHGVTDLAAILPLLVALLLYDKHPIVAGLAIGLSVSTKLLPGPLIAICLFPSKGRIGFVGAFLVGLLPIVPFMAWSWSAFAHNILLFNAIRPMDTTSWLYGLPHTVPQAMHVIAAIAVVAIGITVLVSAPSRMVRCAFCIGIIIISIISAPVAHNNYFIWWIPFFCILLAVHLSHRIDLRSTYPAVDVHA